MGEKSNGFKVNLSIFAFVYKVLVPSSDGALDRTQIYMYNVHVNPIHFVWDEKKNRINQKKYHISFAEAQSAFYDENAYVYFDPDHSEDEERFILLGTSFQLRVLVVCHCYRENEQVIRIISARKANKQEQKDYTGGKK